MTDFIWKFSANNGHWKLAQLKNKYINKEARCHV